MTRIIKTIYKYTVDTPDKRKCRGENSLITDEFF